MKYPTEEKIFFFFKLAKFVASNELNLLISDYKILKSFKNFQRIFNYVQ